MPIKDHKMTSWVRFRRSLFGTCTRTRFLISKSHDSRVSWKEALRIRTHVATCSSCRHYKRQLQIMRRLIRCYVSTHPEAEASWHLSREARERLKQIIRQKMQGADREEPQMEFHPSPVSKAGSAFHVKPRFFTPTCEPQPRLQWVLAISQFSTWVMRRPDLAG